jgi:putative ABC transport system permease protein
MQSKPPWIAQWVLSHTLRQEDRDILLGDFEEFYAEIKNESGSLKASIWYWKQVFKSIPLFILNQIYWSIIMFKNYFKIALRNIVKYKIFSVINITGLAVGIACSILILLWIQNELSYDRFHKNATEIYRVIISPQDNNTFYIFTPGALAAGLKDEFPEVIESTRLHPLYPFDKNPLKHGGKKFYVSGGVVDPSFFDIFTFHFIKGNRKSPFAGPQSIVITEETAKKFFGQKDPLGKTIKFEYWKEWIDLTVSGVIKDIPANSHIQHDFFLPSLLILKMGRNINSWDDIYSPTYILLNKNVQIEKIKEKLSGIIKRHRPESNYKVYLQPLSRIHLFNFGGGGAVTYIYIFSTIGLLILTIAIINFMSLSTARSLNRASEVGIRKTIGASRNQLIRQFVGESLFLSFIALFIAMALVIMTLPYINTLYSTNLEFFNSSHEILFLVVFVVLIGIISGSYPAYYLSNFKPVAVLKGALLSNSRGFSFRKILVIIQFAISISLIICATITYKQLNFLKDTNLGFDKENIINLEMGGSFFHNYSIIKNELEKNPGIVSMTAANTSFTTREKGTYTAKWEGKIGEEKVYMELHPVDFDYLKTFKLKMKEGRFFSKKFPTDSRESVVLNEAAIKAMGIQEPIGKKFSFFVGDEHRNARIIGVVNDFNFLSLHNKVEPLIFVIAPWWFNEVYIRIKPENISKTIRFIKTRLQEFVPDYVFGYTFLDKGINGLYKTEQRVGSLVKYGTTLATFIACLGLFGLASYTSEHRTREIGIRKVLGASITGITFLLTKELLKWILLANIAAWPIAYFIMNQWLQNFAYQTGIRIEIFIFSALATLLIAFLTTSYQSIKAAIANPVESLKYE